MEAEMMRQRDRHVGPCPSIGGGRGRSGGNGWFRCFSSGGFLDAAKKTVLRSSALSQQRENAQLQCLVHFLGIASKLTFYRFCIAVQRVGSR